MQEDLLLEADACMLKAILETDDVDSLVKLMDKYETTDLRVPVFCEFKPLANEPFLVQAAAYFAAEKCFQYLIGSTTITDPKDRKGRDLCYLAAYGGSVEIFAMIVEHGLDFDNSGVNGNTPFHVAAKFGQADLCKWLYINGAKILRNNDGHTPMYLALKNRCISVLAFFIESGCMTCKDVLPGGQNLWTLSVSDPELIELFSILVDANIQQVPDSKGTWALHEACKRKRADIVEALINHQVSVKEIDQNQATALHYAAKASSVELCVMLLEAGADPDAPDAKGRTPVHYSAEAGSIPVFEVLMDWGADVTLPDSNARTALDAAAEKNRTYMYEWLLSLDIYYIASSPTKTKKRGRRSEPL